MEETGRWGKTRKQLLDDVKEKRGSGKIQRRRTTSYCVEKYVLSHNRLENEWICQLFAISFDWIQARNTLRISKTSIYISTKVISPFDNHLSHFDHVSLSLLFFTYLFYARDKFALSSHSLALTPSVVVFCDLLLFYVLIGWMGEIALIDIGIISSPASCL